MCTVSPAEQDKTTRMDQERQRKLLLDYKAQKENNAQVQSEVYKASSKLTSCNLDAVLQPCGRDESEGLFMMLTRLARGKAGRVCFEWQMCSCDNPPSCHITQTLTPPVFISLPPGCRQDKQAAAGTPHAAGQGRQCGGGGAAPPAPTHPAGSRCGRGHRGRGGRPHEGRE